MVLGRSAGLNEEKLRHIGDDPLPEGVYEPVEAAIVEYAQRSTHMQPITNELFEREPTTAGADRLGTTPAENQEWAARCSSSIGAKSAEAVSGIQCDTPSSSSKR